VSILYDGFVQVA